MDSFRWNDCYVTGIGDVDEQHHRLVVLINRFGELLTHHRTPSPEEITPIFDELADYAVYHFREEEQLMRGNGLDERHIGAHCQAHQSFLGEVTSLRDRIAGSGETARFLLEFLTHWLAYHILGQDQVMARQLAAIRSGRPAAEAFAASETARDPATAMLLEALNGLFQQVSERNRDLQHLNATLEARVEERTRELTEANQRLEDLAMTDLLTGLPNRRHALRRFAQDWHRSTAEGTPIACLMIDADGFKQINDTQGHDAGDIVLRELAGALRHGVRTDDLACRLGGDEFFVICPRTPLPGALRLAEELRACVANMRVPAGKGHWAGSISVGVAARTAEMTAVDQLMKAADEGVYNAKRDGRNAVRSIQSA